MTALQVSRVSKSFPGVKALDNVSMTLTGGSVHALLGENGAGKSTLIKIMTGIHAADSGEITMEGRPVRFANPRQAAAGGLGVVHQERNLVTRFSVAENIMLDRLGTHTFSPVDYRALAEESRQWLKQLDLDIDPLTPVSRLSVAQMQLVEIGKALSLKSRVLLLDEPTASLTPSEAQVLFRLLRKLRDDGVAIGFVSHKLEEVFDICDTVTVLRDGKNACDSAALKSLTREDVVKMMIGRAERISRRAPRPQPEAAPLFELRNYSSAAGHENISLSVRPGEILGLYGLVGAGRSELAKAVLGLSTQTGGEILVRGSRCGSPPWRRRWTSASAM
jgi:ribose transport system ATP-binding protein